MQGRSARSRVSASINPTLVRQPIRAIAISPSRRPLFMVDASIRASHPTSRAQLETLVRDGHIANLLHAGARLHQADCNGCIGMGQAPATHALSLRAVPRNFPGRSGTREDKVCLVSSETAAASAL